MRSLSLLVSDATSAPTNFRFVNLRNTIQNKTSIGTNTHPYETYVVDNSLSFAFLLVRKQLFAGCYQKGLISENDRRTELYHFVKMFFYLRAFLTKYMKDSRRREINCHAKGRQTKKNFLCVQFIT